jgi:hypothetical protein
MKEGELIIRNFSLNFSGNKKEVVGFSKVFLKLLSKFSKDSYSLETRDIKCP